MISVCKENLSIEISVHEMSHRLTAYAEVNPTVAIIVMSTCSFTVNGPGFRDMPKNFTLGISLAHNRPTGNDNSWATIWVPIQSGGKAPGGEATYSGYGDGRISEEEKLVHPGKYHCPSEANAPCPYCVDGHVGIVGVRYRRANLGIWRVILC